MRGKVEPLTATKLGRLLGDHGSLRLAWLNACRGATASDLDIFTSTSATLIRRGLPAVVAQQFGISDSAAMELSRVFYEALAVGYLEGVFSADRLGSDPWRVLGQRQVIGHGEIVAVRERSWGRPSR